MTRRNDNTHDNTHDNTNDRARDCPVPLTIARALDRRLHATLEDPLALSHARLYGCTVIDDDALDDSVPFGDPESAVRFTFLGEARLVYDLLDGPLGLVARAFDGAAVVTSGWGAPMNEDGQLDCLPSQHPDRFRLLICTVISDDGICSVVRNGASPDVPVEMAERGVGMMPDALEMMWFGEVRGDMSATFAPLAQSGSRHGPRHSTRHDP